MRERDFFVLKFLGAAEVAARLVDEDGFFGEGEVEGAVRAKVFLELGIAGGEGVVVLG